MVYVKLKAWKQSSILISLAGNNHHVLLAPPPDAGRYLPTLDLHASVSEVLRGHGTYQGREKEEQIIDKKNDAIVERTCSSTCFTDP